MLYIPEAVLAANSETLQEISELLSRELSLSLPGHDAQAFNGRFGHQLGHESLRQ